MARGILVLCTLKALLLELKSASIVTAVVVKRFAEQGNQDPESPLGRSDLYQPCE